MGSGGHGGNYDHSSGFSPEDIQAFAQSSVGRRKTTTGQTAADLLTGATKDLFNQYDPNTNSSSEVTKYFSSNGTMISQDIVDAFNSFVANKKASKDAHDQYVKMLKDQPGRRATLISPLSGQETKTLVGNAPGKTVLG